MWLTLQPTLPYGWVLSLCIQVQSPGVSPVRLILTHMTSGPKKVHPPPSGRERAKVSQDMSAILSLDRKSVSYRTVSVGSVSRAPVDPKGIRSECSITGRLPRWRWTQG